MALVLAYAVTEHDGIQMCEMWKADMLKSINMFLELEKENIL